MSKSRLGKDIKLDNISDRVRVSIGCVDRLNPVVVYISGKTWVKSNEGDFTDAIQHLVYRKVYNAVKRVVSCHSDTFNNRYIFDFDLNLCGQKPGGSKFVTFDLYLTQGGNIVRNLRDLKDVMGDIAFEVCNEMSYAFESNDVDVSKVKIK